MNITYIRGDEVSLEIVVNNAQDETKIHHYIYYIVDNKTDNRIGELMIYQTDVPKEFLYCGNVGIELYQEYRYKGYAGKAFELAKTVLRLLGFDKVTLTCEVHNSASFNSMKKVGASYIGRRFVPDDNFAYDENFKEINVFEYDLKGKK